MWVIVSSYIIITYSYTNVFLTCDRYYQLSLSGELISVDYQESFTLQRMEENRTTTEVNFIFKGTFWVNGGIDYLLVVSLYVCVFQALIVVVILGWLFVPIYIKAGVNTQASCWTYKIPYSLYMYIYISHIQICIHNQCNLRFLIIYCIFKGALCNFFVGL